MENTLVGHDTMALDSLLEKVYQDAGYDFREYKRGTVMRRLERRLYASGAGTYLGYMQFLDDNPEEYHRLARDITIKASGFFRNQYAFQQLVRLVLPELISRKWKQGERRLSFWSTACAGGEEPYSIAMALAQYLGSGLPDFDVIINATDIDQEALRKAQAGVYSSKDVEGLAVATRENCFTRQGESYDDACYLVTDDIRQMVSFSYFNLVSTQRSPFMNLDCIFCCNVLIYMQRQLQERVLGMLYDSLATPAYLILGEVETPTAGIGGELECLDVKARIYKKNRTDYRDA